MMKKNRKYRFFLHYNKPLSKQMKEHTWSVHYRDTCHFVRQIDCRVPTVSKTNERQPYVVMQGMAEHVIVHPEDKTALIL